MDYLNKKQWHTGSIKNIARVWQKEQEAARQIQKQEEYKKKLLEEQHAHELKVAQVEAGLIPKSALEKMDWMYNPILGQQPQETEQYLLGKQVDLNNLPQNTKQQDPRDNSNKYQAIVTEDVTNSTCENFTLIHEDPLFKMMQEEQKMREKLLNNPLDVNKFMEEIRKVKELKKQKEEGGKKKKDKKEKKEKKDKKKKKHRSSDEKESKKNKNKSRSRSRSQRKSKKESKSNSKKDKKRRKSRSSSSSSSSVSSRSNSKEKKSQKSTSISEKNHKLRRNSRSSSSAKSLSPESKLKQIQYEQYLQKKVGNILVRGDDGILRPDFGLMKRKYRNNLRPEEKIQMTEEEKKERLKEMQENAKELTKERLKEFKDDYQDKDYNNDESNIKDLHSKQNNPKFLHEINKEIYIGKKDINSLADKISMNKNRLARNLEEKNTFK
ncbi:Pre-mRNA splicing factor (macronuclear) [Tetrahymena thermophila SB210]|uniref:Pre-mRNA splicing factor n=1 Tax=Tetrahymena thermophila (strain SB210) TaxID=312017 RepID=I7MFS3_TETTS|nr:Pre-mRNA splicing factor [Tetrahymena thermophila SB210]EAS00543.1 Pre-mRNA splicing factor [Tetrahymena thermophila SB210]|eukprot:XP_001020788.1 Pre-mRNA splicing factor [Tetrahymena thermophila SB210]